MRNFLRSIAAVLSVAVMISACKKPTANFSADKTEVEIGEVVTFTNSSEDATIYMWDFGDGTQSSQKNPTHVYDTPGTYQVTMTSAKNKMKKPADATAVTITVKAPAKPTADFTASKTTGMPGEVFTFAATDTSADEFVWDFGDGQMSLSPNPTHVYQMGGTYTVSLTVYGWDRKYTDTKTKTITIGNATGDYATIAALVGKWKISSHALTNTVNNTAVAACNSNAPYSVSFTSAQVPVIEVTANNTMFLYDMNNNIRGSANYNVIDNKRMTWSHNALYNNGGFSTINGTNVPTYGPNIIWNITTLNATTLTLTFTYTNSSGSAYTTCSPSPGGVISGTQVITETVTYTKQ